MRVVNQVRLLKLAGRVSIWVWFITSVWRLDRFPRLVGRVSIFVYPKYSCVSPVRFPMELGSEVSRVPLIFR